MKWVVRYRTSTGEKGVHGRFDTEEEADAAKTKAEAYFAQAELKATVSITYEDAAGNVLPKPKPEKVSG